MARKDRFLDEEWKQIEIAIELDRGSSIVEISRRFKVSVSFVKRIAAKAAPSESRKIRRTNRRVPETEKELLLERIENGEDLKELASGAGVKKETLQRWCRLRGIEVPRSLDQLSARERREIREMLEEFDWKEVARSYRLSSQAVEALREPPYRNLDAESLAYLFELMKEQPKLTDAGVMRAASEVGLELPREAVESYRKRLQKMRII